jgi:hypothetical protein
VALTADRYFLKSECWPFFILNHSHFPLSWEERITLQGTSLSTDASWPSLDCSFGFIRAGAFDKQEANVVILEDDSLKQ